uniref:Ring finger protein 41 n=1 Tax=Mus musculus TaxID=10090 RepID=A0A1W2P811_MOUSE
MGYDVTRFQGDVDEDLICPICSGVLEEPVQAGSLSLSCIPSPALLEVIILTDKCRLRGKRNQLEVILDNSAWRCPKMNCQTTIALSTCAPWSSSSSRALQSWRRPRLNTSTSWQSRSETFSC